MAPLIGYGNFINGINFVHPHGATSNFAFDTFFIGSEYGNSIYRFYPSGILTGGQFMDTISIDGNPPVQTDAPTGLSDPHALLMAADFSKFYVTCEGTNQVRVIDAHTRKLDTVLQVGTFPQEAAFSRNPATPYLFITCMQDNNNPPTNQGTVYVFNYNTYQLVKVLSGDFFQPHGICVDDRDGLVYIPSSNLSQTGPPPHHCLPGDCHPGWYTVYSISTLQPVNSIRYEVPKAPYSICARFAQ
jgi:sugar lactone lactonase YvrE